MKYILLLRHAKSSWEDTELDDLDRPLNARGEAQAPQVGTWLLGHHWVPDVIYASHALRAQQTARAVAQACGYTGPILTRPDLYRTDAERYRRVAAATLERYQRIMLVGHNPEIEEFLNSLVKDAPPMKTAALAIIELPIAKWDELHERTRGTLVVYFKPEVARENEG